MSSETGQSFLRVGRTARGLYRGWLVGLTRKLARRNEPRASWPDLYRQVGLWNAMVLSCGCTFLSLRCWTRLIQFSVQWKQLSKFLRVGRKRLRTTSARLSRCCIRLWRLLQNNIDGGVSRHSDHNARSYRHSGYFLIRSLADVVAESLPHEIRFTQGLVQTALSQKQRTDLTDTRKRPNQSVVLRKFPFAA